MNRVPAFPLDSGNKPAIFPKANIETNKKVTVDPVSGMPVKEDIRLGSDKVVSIPKSKSQTVSGVSFDTKTQGQVVKDVTLENDKIQSNLPKSKLRVPEFTIAEPPKPVTISEGFKEPMKWLESLETKETEQRDLRQQAKLGKDYDKFLDLRLDPTNKPGSHFNPYDYSPGGVLETYTNLKDGIEEGTADLRNKIDNGFESVTRPQDNFGPNPTIGELGVWATDPEWEYRVSEIYNSLMKADTTINSHSQGLDFDGLTIAIWTQEGFLKPSAKKEAYDLLKGIRGGKLRTPDFTNVQKAIKTPYDLETGTPSKLLESREGGEISPSKPMAQRIAKDQFIKESIGNTIKSLEQSIKEAIKKEPKGEKIETKQYGLLGPMVQGKVEPLLAIGAQKEKRNEIANLKIAKKFNEDFLKQLKEEKGHFFVEFVEEMVGEMDRIMLEPEKLLPFAGTAFKFEDLMEGIYVADKVKNGEELTDVDKSYLEKFKAVGLPIERGAGAMLANIMTQMPTYAMEFSALRGLVAKPVQMAFGKQVVKYGALGRSVAKWTGVEAQAIVFSTIKLPTAVAEEYIPYRKELSHPLFNDFYKELGEFNLLKTIGEQFAVNALEVITEYAGDLVQKPVTLMGRAILAKFFHKTGFKMTNMALSKFKKGIGWNDPFFEVFEEELNEKLQANLLGKPYDNPFTTTEGFTRLWVETLGFSIMGKAMQAPMAAQVAGKKIYEAGKPIAEKGIETGKAVFKAIKEDKGAFIKPYEFVPGKKKEAAEKPVVKELVKDLDKRAVELFIKRQGKETYESKDIGTTLERIAQKAEEYDPVFLEQHPEIKGHDITVYHDPIAGEDLAVIDDTTNKIVEILDKELATIAKPKELQPLAEEAKKYKSAEEFVKKALPQILNSANLADAGKKYRFYDYSLETKEIKNLRPTEKISLKDEGIKEYETKIKAGEIIPPIIINTKGNILNGHTRLQAYKNLGIKDISVLTAEQENKYDTARIINLTKQQLTDIYNQTAKEVKPVKPTLKQKLEDALIKPSLESSKAVKEAKPLVKRIESIAEISKTPITPKLQTKLETLGIAEDNAKNLLAEGEYKTYVEGWSEKCFPKDIDDSERFAYAEKETPKIAKEHIPKGFEIVESGYIDSDVGDNPWGATYAIYKETKLSTEAKIETKALPEITSTNEESLTPEEQQVILEEEYKKTTFEDIDYEDIFYPETDKENNYQTFKAIFSKPGVSLMKEKLSSGDADSFITALKNNKSIKADALEVKMAVQKYLGNLLYSQDASNNEIFDQFRGRLETEDPGLLYGRKIARQLGLKGMVSAEAVKTRDTKEVKSLPQRLKDITTFVILPAIKQKARLFGLLGNKLTSIPVFREVFDKWAKSGVETIVEVYGGAFTLVPHSLDKAVDSGLKNFYSNIWDVEKFKIIKEIKNNRINSVKASYERSIRSLDDAIIARAQKAEGSSVIKTIEAFKAKFPDKIVGSVEWYTYIRNETPVGARVMTLKDEYNAWREVLQGAINDVYVTKIKTLDEATMKAYINRIGVYNDKGQKFIGNKGFRMIAGAIYNKQGIFNALDTINDSFKLLKKKGVNVKLFNRDGAELTNFLKFKDNSKVGWVFDPPYTKTAKTYKNLKNVKNFLTGESFIDSHSAAFNGKSKVALTNDVAKEWIDPLMNKMSESTIFAYKEGSTPTSLILSEDMTGDMLDMIERRKKVGATGAEKFVNSFTQSVIDIENKVVKKYRTPALTKEMSEKFGNIIPDDQFYNYEVLWANDKLTKQKGNVDTIISVLSNSGVRQEIIDMLKVNDVYLKDMVKFKREKTKIVSTAISKKVISYIKNTSNIKNHDEVEIKKWFTGMKNTAKWAVAGYEVPMRFFKRLGEGFSKMINQPIRESERAAVKKADWIKIQLPSWFRTPKARLNSAEIIEREGLKILKRKERIRINAYFMSKQGVKNIPKELLEIPLTKREGRGYDELVELFDILYPEVERVAKIMGTTIHKIPNYSPLMLSSDLKILQFGSLYEIRRKDPYFSSIKERTGPTDYRFYEKDMGKIMKTWLDNAARFIEMSETTNKIKYLIESDDFKALVSPDIHKKITDWYDFVVNTPEIKGGATVLRWLRGRQATFILGLRYTVPVKQFLNLIDLWDVVGTMDILKGFRELYKNKQLAQYVKNSPAVIERDMVDITMTGLNDAMFEWMKKPTVYTDQMTAKLSKIILMRKLIERHMDQGDKMNYKLWKKIDRFSNDMVDGVMGAISKSQTPTHFRTEAGKNWNMFMSQLTAKAGFHVQDIWFHQNPEMWEELPQSHRKAILKSITSLIIIAMLENLITNLSFPDDPEDIAKDTLISLIGNFPTLGGIAYSVRSGQSYSPMPVLGNVVRIFKEWSLINSSVKRETKEKHLKELVWYATGLLGNPRALKLFYEGTAGAIRGYVEVGGKKIYLRGIEKWLAPLKGKYGSQAAKDVFRKEPAESAYKKGGSAYKESGSAYKSKRRAYK